MLKAGMLVATFAALTLATPAAAQSQRLFNDATEHAIVLEGPIDAVVRRAERNVDPAPAVVILGDARFDIEIQARGMFRRVGGACSFPPLRLNFQREQVRGTVFHGQNRLKLVTRCRTGTAYEQLLVREYLVYRLFNVITPQSFRAHPLRVTYRDTEGRRREETQFNFVIEDIDDVARRNNAIALDVETGDLRSTGLDPRATAVVSLFQFMIGNLDWDYTNAAEGRSCCHNMNHLAASQTSRDAVIPVPYDFDHSGFVDAPYATPPEGVNVRNVRVRYYRGFCRHNDQLPAVIDLFRNRRSDLLAVIDGEARLTDSSRRQARAYIESFFTVLDNPNEVNRQLIERCRGQSTASGAGAG